MDERAIFAVLELDSIYRLLTWEERMIIHLYIKGKMTKLNPKIIKIYNWIKKSRWEAPKMIFKQDRLFYYTDYLSGNDKHLDDYPKNNEEITEQIKKLNI